MFPYGSLPLLRQLFTHEEKQFNRNIFSGCSILLQFPELRQNNQHEVDFERAANSLFQWDFDKCTTSLRLYQSIINIAV